MTYRKDLFDLLTPAANAVGVELWGCEFISQGKQSLLRVYIDKPEGVTLNDCELASKQISMLLTVADPIRSDYQLEVSSPGLARPLFVARHYQQCIGQQIKIHLLVPIEGKRRLQGTIAIVEQDELVLIDGDKKFRVPFANVTKAHTVYSQSI